jgi:hypothetical protein
MKSLSEHNLLVNKVPAILVELLGLSQTDIDVHPKETKGVDIIAHSGEAVLVVEFKKTTSAGSVTMAAKQVREYARTLGTHAVPVVAVPFMGNVGQKVCEEERVCWLDLCGNAHIVAPGIRVIVSGRPNLYKSAGRQPNLFAPKSSRIVRWMLIHPDQYMSQREIARSTNLDEGFISRLVARLESEEFVIRNERSAVRPRNPALLFNAWYEVYQFNRHTVRKGHVAARSGDALLRFVNDTFAEWKVAYVATGLAAAWVLTKFAAFRVVTLYLPADPPQKALQQLGWRDEPRGANLWLVTPNDSGVLQGGKEVDGIPCVHPVQVCLDLKGQPERSAEAAERLRAEFLAWRRND